jgi:hypothetical protein
MINTHTKKYFSPTFFTLSKFGNRCSRCSHLNLFCSTAFVDVRPAKFQAICLESFSIKIEIGFFFFAIDDDDNEEDGDVVGGCGCWIRCYQK